MILRVLEVVALAGSSHPSGKFTPGAKHHNATTNSKRRSNFADGATNSVPGKFKLKKGSQDYL